MKLISKIKFYLSMFANAGKYNLFLQQITNKRFFNNYDKVIGWQDGKPSFFLMAPLVFSKPSAHSLSTRIASLFQWRKLPDMVDIALTDVCNCNCLHCSFVSMKKNKNILSKEEYIKVINEVQDLGVSTINIVGGEPFLNSDFIDILKSVDKDRSQIVIFTNGYYLKEKIKELKKAGVTTIIVSLDSTESAVHDKNKGLKGSFNRAIEGIKLARKNKFLVGVSHVVYKEDIYNGELIKFIEFAKELNVNEIILFDAVQTGNLSNKKNLNWNEKDYNEFLKICNYYHNKNNYPGIFPYYYMRSVKSVGCAGGVVYFYISPYGEVCPCDFNPNSIGNIKEKSINELWDHFSDYKEFSKSQFNGCNMKNSQYKKGYK